MRRLGGSAPALYDWCLVVVAVDYYYSARCLTCRAASGFEGSHGPGPDQKRRARFRRGVVYTSSKMAPSLKRPRNWARKCRGRSRIAAAASRKTSRRAGCRERFARRSGRPVVVQPINHVKPPGHLPLEELHRHAVKCTNVHFWSHSTITVCNLPTGSVSSLLCPSFPGGR